MTNLPPRKTRYFVAGGALRLSVPSYVERPADTELFEKVRAGDFCYVLTPRQMGKSSLMVRTDRRLKDEDTHTVIIDLTEIGDMPIDKWYQGLLTKLQRALDLSVVVKSWWQERVHLGAPQRLHQFVVDEVLPHVEGNIVIFIDEIDSTLNLDFRDDFFAAIRAFYNGRSRNPELERVTFVLLGVASPSELIEDRFRTPFNIGEEINLQEFDQQDAQVLLDGLAAKYPEQAQAIFDRIFYWTGGHPYLTQRLCVHITEDQSQTWEDVEIDRLVQQLFLRDEARGETNIQFVSDRILKSPEREKLLKLYKQVYTGKIIADNKQSQVQNQLFLSGLVKTSNGHLIVRNQIYRQAFDLDWIKKETATNWALWVTAIAVSVALIAIGLLIWETILLPDRAEGYVNDFYAAKAAPTQAAALTGLMNLNPRIGNNNEYKNRARGLVFDPRNSWDDQSNLLDPVHYGNPEKLLMLIESSYIALANVGNDVDTTHMLSEINENLVNWPSENEKATRLQFEIQKWLEARAEKNNRNYDSSQRLYREAIDVNSENPATHFELAHVYILIAGRDASTATGDEIETYYDLALRELDAVVEITLRMEPQTDEEFATPLPLPVNTLTPTTSTLAMTLTPTSIASTTPATGSIEPSPEDSPNASPSSIIDHSATSTLQPTATPLPPAFTPKGRVIPVFIAPNERINAVRKLIEENSVLLLYGQQADETSYVNLRAINFISSSPILVLEEKSESLRFKGFINELDSGLMITGAQIIIASKDGTISQRVVSDSNGAFQVDLPLGYYLVTYTHDEYKTYSETFDARYSGEYTAEILLESLSTPEQSTPGSLQVFVNERDSGVMIVGAKIIFESEVETVSRATLTDSIGSTQIDLAPGSYLVTASHDDYESFSGSFTRFGAGKQIWNIALDPKLTDEESTEKILQGLVIDRDSGLPISGARIVFENVDRPLRRETVSNFSGQFQMGLPLGPYSITVTHNDYERYRVLFTAADSDILTSNLTLKPLSTAKEPAPEWKSIRGNWDFADDIISAQGNIGFNKAYMVERNFDDLTYEVTFRKTSNNDGPIGIMFRYDEIDDTGYFLLLWPHGGYQFSAFLGEARRVITGEDPGSTVNLGNEWNTVVITAIGPEITISINDNEVASFTDNTFLSGKVGLVIHGGTEQTAEFKNLMLIEP